jgi:S-adenosylmethionine-dependent methyltransferase
MMPAMHKDAWAPLADRFVGGHYGSLRGRVRTHVLHENLRPLLPAPPASIVDVGGGGGHDAVPLARAGYQVTLVDPSEAMLERANALIAGEEAEVRGRISIVHARGEDAPATLGRAFQAVLCHGVVMYLDNPGELEAALAELAAADAIVSIVQKNARALAARPALAGRWQEALTAFDADRQVNGLDVDTRADTVEGLSARMNQHGVDLLAWHGVRLFTDGWTPERPATDSDPDVLAVELEASRRDPYRQLSRLFHYIGRRRGRHIHRSAAHK